MKLTTKLGSGISLGIAFWYLYHHQWLKRFNSHLKHMQSQTDDLKNSLQNVKTSIQQFRAILPLLKSKHSLIEWKMSCSLLQKEQLQLQKSIQKLMP